MRTLLTNADILLRKEEGSYETLRGAYLGINDNEEALNDLKLPLA